MRNSCSGDVTSVTGTISGLLPGEPAAGPAGAVLPVRLAPLPAPVAAMLAAMAETWKAEQRLTEAADAAGLPRLPGAIVAALLRLAEAPRALSSAEIQRNGLYAGANFSYGLNLLVTAGLVWTTQHPSDKRRQQVIISAAGRRAVAAILAELES